MSQFFEATFLPPPGADLKGCYAQVNYAGTIDPAPIFSDYGLTTPITQPVDISSGQLQFYVASGLVNANAITAGNYYTIQSIGTTDFTSIGANSNTVGVTFKSTGIGSGTGTAYFEYDLLLDDYEFEYALWR